MIVSQASVHLMSKIDVAAAYITISPRSVRGLIANSPTLYIVSRGGQKFSQTQMKFAVSCLLPPIGARHFILVAALDIYEAHPGGRTSAHLSPASSYRASQAFTRRKIVAATCLFSSSGLVNQVAARTTRPNDWGLYPEGRPYTRYIDNAGKVASHLAWYVDGDESSAIASARLQAELAQFASTYQPALHQKC